MAAVRIIVNADDFGISREVNETITGLLEGGYMRSTSLLANGPYVGEASRFGSGFRNCSFGAHLNLTEFAPLSAIGKTVLVDQSGQMSKQHLQKQRPSLRLWRAVYEECCAQVETLQGLGVSVSHIDSHHHGHTIPAIFPAIKAVQRKFGIRRIRASRNLYKESEPAGAALLFKKRAFNFCLRNFYNSNTPGAFTDFETLLQVGAAGAKFGIVEVMVHPGARGHDHETAILRTAWLDSLPYQGRLASYLEL